MTNSVHEHLGFDAQYPPNSANYHIYHFESQSSITRVMSALRARLLSQN